MKLNQARIDMLKRLAGKPLTVIDLVDEEKLKIVQWLARTGYAIDFGGMYGRRVEIRLRIWGISPAGKAVLEQVAMVETTTKQPALVVLPKELSEAGKGEKKRVLDRWFQGRDNKWLPRYKRPAKLPPVKPPITITVKEEASKPSKPEVKVEPKIETSKKEKVTGRGRKKDDWTLF